ncbi:MAG: flagellar basal body rod protein FlgB [Spirochaetia bacterium]|nr:flagellar basal body rod protein FlgB [Spirochaetia bacterium]
MIDSNLNWNKAVYFLEKGLDTAELRGKVVSDNIANVDTPHFKRSEVAFEAQLRRALDSEKYVKENEVPAKVTDSRHFSFYKSLDYKDVSSKINVDYLSTMRNDGNNIDVEHEMNLALKNQMTYEMMTGQINNHFRMLSMVMRTA